MNAIHSLSHPAIFPDRKILRYFFYFCIEMYYNSGTSLLSEAVEFHDFQSCRPDSGKMLPPLPAPDSITATLCRIPS